MKVLLISSYPTKGCGVSKYTEELIGGLKENGTEVDSMRIRFIEGWLPSIKAILRISRSVLSIKPEIVHIQYTPTTSGPLILPFVLFLRILGSMKLVVTCHEKPDGYLKHLKNRYLSAAFLLYEKYLLRLTDRIIVHSRDHKERIIALYGIGNEKIVIIPHGVPPRPDITSARVLQVKDKLRIGNETVITFFGAIRPNKGVELLIRAFSNVLNNHANLILLIAGQVPTSSRGYFERLIELVGSLGIDKKVVFAGFVEDFEIPGIIDISRMIVLPYTESTQSGVLFREVIPYSKPVIVSDVGGLGEATKEYNIGIVTPKGNVDLLAEAIRRLLSDEGFARFIALNQARVRESLSWTNISKRHLEIYRQTIGKDDTTGQPAD